MEGTVPRNERRSSPAGTAITDADLRELARTGAEARLRALEAERAALLRMFPDLRSPVRATGIKASQPRQRRGRRRPMTGAERKAVSLRMKKYWAARRARTKAASR